MVGSMAALAAAQEGDNGSDGFTAVIRRETPHLLFVAHSILDDRAASEDAVQDCLLLAWRAWDRLRDPERRTAWLVRICVRECLRSRRARLARFRRESGGSDPELELLPAPSVPEPPIDFSAAWHLLSPGQRAVLTLHYFHGYRLDECAAAMGCRPGTARRHLARGLEKLRREASA
jgi:RNA polymerase sigma-70 factor, ECF subfamily